MSFSLVIFLRYSSTFCVIVMHKDDMYLTHYLPGITTDYEITTYNNTVLIVPVILSLLNSRGSIQERRVVVGKSFIHLQPVKKAGFTSKALSGGREA